MAAPTGVALATPQPPTAASHGAQLHQQPAVRRAQVPDAHAARKSQLQAVYLKAVVHELLSLAGGEQRDLLRSALRDLQKRKAAGQTLPQGTLKTFMNMAVPIVGQDAVRRADASAKFKVRQSTLAQGQPGRVPAVPAQHPGVQRQPMNQEQREARAFEVASLQDVESSEPGDKRLTAVFKAASVVGDSVDADQAKMLRFTGMTKFEGEAESHLQRNVLQPQQCAQVLSYMAERHELSAAMGTSRDKGQAPGLGGASGLISEAVQAYLREVLSTLTRVRRQRANVSAGQFGRLVQWGPDMEGSMRAEYNGLQQKYAEEERMEEEKLREEIEEADLEYEKAVLAHEKSTQKRKRQLKEASNGGATPRNTPAPPVAWWEEESQRVKSGGMDMHEAAIFNAKLRICKSNSLGPFRPDRTRNGKRSRRQVEEEEEAGSSSKRMRIAQEGSVEGDTQEGPPGSTLLGNVITMKDVVHYLAQQRLPPRSEPKLASARPPSTATPVMVVDCSSSGGGDEECCSREVSS